MIKILAGSVILLFLLKTYFSKNGFTILDECATKFNTDITACDLYGQVIGVSIVEKCQLNCEKERMSYKELGKCYSDCIPEFQEFSFYRFTMSEPLTVEERNRVYTIRSHYHNIYRKIEMKKKLETF